MHIDGIAMLAKRFFPSMSGIVSYHTLFFHYDVFRVSFRAIAPYNRTGCELGDTSSEVNCYDGITAPDKERLDRSGDECLFGKRHKVTKRCDCLR